MTPTQDLEPDSSPQAEGPVTVHLPERVAHLHDDVMIRDLSRPYGYLSLTARAAELLPETEARAGSWGCELLIGCRAIEPSY